MHKISCVVVMTAIGWCASAPVFAQGSLDPSGAPIPSMRTLQQIEPSTPVDAVPFTISQPGPYHLSRNLHHSTTGSAIVITASDVILDGRGFVITGNPASGTLIAANTAGTNRKIKVIGLGSSGQDGIDLRNTKHAVIEDVHVFNNAGAGVRISSGEIMGLHTENNGGPGVYMGNPVPGIGIVVKKHPNNLYSHRNGGGGVVIEGDMDIELSGVIRENTGHGIRWSPATPTDGLRLKLDACDSSGNTGDGLHISGVSSSPVQCDMAGVTFNNNGGAGVFNSKPIPGIGIVVKKNPGSSSARNNGAGGIVLEGDCDVEFAGVVSGNTGDGIKWTSLNPDESPRIKLEDAVIENNTGNGVLMVTVDPVEMDFTATRSRFENNGVAGVDLHAPSLASDVRVVFTDCAVEKNTGAGAKVKGGAVFRPSTGTWRSSHISDNGEEGLLLEGVTPHIEDSVVRGNGKDGLKGDGKKHTKPGHVTLLKRTVFVNNGGNGVHISSSEDDAECRVIVQDSQLNGNTQSGLHLETTHPGSVASLSWYNSQASHNDFSGIVVTGATGTGKGSITLRGGDCDDSGAHGIVIAHPEINAGLITGMSVARNGGSGIVSAGQSISIVGNVVAGNAAAGIRVEGDNHFLDDNRCVNNAVGIELAGNNNALAKNVYGGPQTPFIDFTGTNPSAPIQDVTVGVNPLGNIIY
ncbi:MAG TPA: right-handed parallel beta-helix repeat-containing protein [Kiritimatiellia bacterium]|nr:right-handed parallel beta-helix repeat-containing protein [Kiritimatiellia bacterium]